MGFVYVLHQPASGLYKIGRAENLAERVGQVNVRMEAGRRGELVRAWKVGDPRKFERDLHRAFGDRSRRHPDLPHEGRTEWFALSSHDFQSVRVLMLLEYLRSRR